MQAKLLNMVKEIEQELYAYLNEEVVIYDGMEYVKDKLQEVENEEGVVGYLINNDFVSEDEMEHLTLSDYISDCLEVERYECNDGYIGSSVWITGGGPNISINTVKGCIVASWGNNYLEYPLSDELLSAIDEVVEDC